METSPRLGGGAYGAVFKGTFGNEMIAAKTFYSFQNPALYGLSDPESLRGALKEFINELSALSQLNHPNLVRLRGVIYDNWQGGSLVIPKWIIMEFIDGTTLHKLIHEQKERSLVPSIESIASQLAEVLVYFSSVGFVHRDLKPENILVNNQHKVIVADLGLARPFLSTTITTAERRMTRIGTPLYAAPEIFDEQTTSYGSEVDVYSYGVVLLEVLLREVPKELGLRRDSQIQRALTKNLKLGQLIHSCLSLVPSNRPKPTEIQTLLQS
jgi:serine/threonine protein kinase